MSRALDVLQMKGEDVLKFLAVGIHLDGTNLDFQMKQYIYHLQKEKNNSYLQNKFEEDQKLLVEASTDVSVRSSRNTGQQAMLKFAAATRATPIAGHFTLGTITNQI